jgi:hypothetical protein
MKRLQLAVMAVVVVACRSAAAPEAADPSAVVASAAVDARLQVPASGAGSGSASGSASASASASGSSSGPEAGTAAAARPTVATFPAQVAADDRWIAASRRERRFKSVALEGMGPVHLAWTRGPEHVNPGSGMPTAQIGLELTRDGRTTRVELGDITGSIEPESATLCDRLGYRLSNGAALAPPLVDGLVSSLSVGGASGSDDLMVVLGPRFLHVLRAQTSDGMCEAMTTQGPLTVCRGSEYARVAEIALGAAASFTEEIRVTSDDDAGATVRPLDCAAPTIMGALVPPGGP